MAIQLHPPVFIVGDTEYFKKLDFLFFTGLLKVSLHHGIRSSSRLVGVWRRNQHLNTRFLLFVLLQTIFQY